MPITNRKVVVARPKFTATVENTAGTLEAKVLTSAVSFRKPGSQSSISVPIEEIPDFVALLAELTEVLAEKAELEAQYPEETASADDEDEEATPAESTAPAVLTDEAAAAAAAKALKAAK